MKKMWVVLLVVLCVSCGSRPPQPPEVPPGPTLRAMAVIVNDLVSTFPVEGVEVTAEGQVKGRTNVDGYIDFAATQGRQIDVIVRKDGYVDNTASLLLMQGNDTLSTYIKKIPPPEPPKPLHPNPIVGRLRIDGDCFRDDTGCVNPVYAHAGDLFSLYTRDQHRARDQLDGLAGVGYHGLRTWATLGGSFWQGRHVGPDITPDYFGHVEAFFQDLQQRKLRVVWSQGDVGQLKDRRDYMSRIAAIDNRVPAIDWLDCGNEAWQTGEPDANKLAQCVGYYEQAGGKALLTLTSPPGEGKEELDQYSIPPADAYDVHSYRGGHSWDKRRHIFSIPYEGKPEKRFGINSEPPGNGALVSVTENKSELDHEAIALLGLSSALARMAHVWFSGEGVWITTGLQGEYGYASTPRAIALLPKDIAQFRTLHHSGDSWRSHRVLVPTGQVRIDGRMGDDGRFAYTIDGPAGTYLLQVEKGFTGKLCDPGTSTCEDVSKTTGQRLEVSFVRGRLLVGRVQ